MDDLKEALKKMTLGKENALEVEKNEKWNYNRGDNRIDNG